MTVLHCAVLGFRNGEPGSGSSGLTIKASKATHKALYWFHFAFTFATSTVGKPEWVIPPSLAIKKGVELQCSD